MLICGGWHNESVIYSIFQMRIQNRKSTYEVTLYICMHSLLACALPQVLCVQGGIALLGQAQLELCHYLAEVDDYIPLACSFHPDAITGDLHIFVVSCTALLTLPSCQVSLRDNTQMLLHCLSSCMHHCLQFLAKGSTLQCIEHNSMAS